MYGRPAMAKAKAKKKKSTKAKPKAKVTAKPKAKAKAKKAKLKAKKVKAKATPKPPARKTPAPAAAAPAALDRGGPPLLPGASLVDAATAHAKYQVMSHLGGDWYEKFDLVQGPAHVAGDFILDHTADGDEGADGLIVEGDLVIDGALVNRDSDNGPCLVVTGNVRAKNVIAGGAEIVILGELIVENVIFGFYNHGSITVHGATKARAIITEYHAFDLRGPVDGVTVSGRGNITAADTYRSYAPVLIPDILAPGNPEGGYPDWDRTADAILAGKSILREDVTN